MFQGVIDSSMLPDTAWGAKHDSFPTLRKDGSKNLIYQCLGAILGQAHLVDEMDSIAYGKVLPEIAIIRFKGGMKSA